MKLFVANIARECSEDELREAFSACGEVTSLKIIKDRDTGQSRGFGFVEMVDKEAAQKAIQELHDKELKGRPLVVNEARDKEGSQRGGGHSNRGRRSF